MRKFSIVIITKNEVKNIARCLSSVQGLSDDIVILDSGSTDGTQEICQSFGANVFFQDFKDFSHQKNTANAKAKYDWILSLDADEAFSDELRKAFVDFLKSDDNRFLEFNRLTNYCGHWVRHCGWYPDWKLRFFNRRHTQWEGSIHEVLKSSVELKVHRLNGHLYHYSYYTLNDHKAQAEKFTQMKALRMKKAGKSDNWFLSFLSGVWKFIQIYGLKSGFLDGKAGWNIALISSHFAMQRYRLRDKSRKTEVGVGC